MRTALITLACLPPLFAVGYVAATVATCWWYERWLVRCSGAED